VKSILTAFLALLFLYLAFSVGRSVGKQAGQQVIVAEVVAMQKANNG